MAAVKSYHYFADNGWHEPASRTWFDSFNPTTGEVWAYIPRCNAEDIDRAVQAAHAERPLVVGAAIGRNSSHEAKESTVAR